MGVYARLVLPRLIDLAMDNRVVAEIRRRVVPAATGRVLEIGLGSGLNLPFYGAAVRRLTAIDPSIELWRLARKRVGRAPFPVRFVSGSAERMPFAAASFDTVLTTWTLCSIPDPAAALAEVRRVLAPDGRLLFAEHGQSPDAGIRRWQGRLDPLWGRLAGGCHLSRPIGDLIRDAGFAVAQMDTGYAAGPRVMSYQFRGVAHRPA